ncbi:MAG: hypothetical protein ACI4U2_00460, partial [Christensenellaceae bacterium]
MNLLFCLLFLVSLLFFLFSDPEGFLPALLAGSSKAIELCLTLLSSYAIWMGFFALLEAGGADKLLSRLFRPALKKLFRTDDQETLSCLTENVSANLLGLGGAATPSGVRAAKLLSAQPQADKNCSMLLLVNASSLQLIPTTVISLRL